MPYINLRVAGELNREQKQQIVAEFTQTMVRVANKPAEYVIVTIDEAPLAGWGWGGQLLDEAD
ncbi:MULTISPECIES: tautomerase family protein [Deefgea]|uniref:4-oxalocrotonate tautomerase n=1 Tax=Deefgea chitinilytica TaxID=570276 RepID=A0ABS2CAA3_9NEIS|nr:MULTISPECIES: 4-oxalocrotonate tautomerase family protein [Deefgea]MBM5570306.1 4-oxalocrotonate tautomerase [Deefgea chitinilytica]MBM9887535.1 4-oxalocrotonate tautomerase family protein [Deefgea sp. CFH1-16]